MLVRTPPSRRRSRHSAQQGHRLHRPSVRCLCRWVRDYVSDQGYVRAGAQTFWAVELHTIAPLTTNLAAGTKVRLTNPVVRRGTVLLMVGCLEVLGGRVQLLEDARQRLRTHWNQPVGCSLLTVQVRQLCANVTSPPVCQATCLYLQHLAGSGVWGKVFFFLPTSLQIARISKRRMAVVAGAADR